MGGGRGGEQKWGVIHHYYHTQHSSNVHLNYMNICSCEPLDTHRRRDSLKPLLYLCFSEGVSLTSGDMSTPSLSSIAFLSVL